MNPILSFPGICLRKSTIKIDDGENGDDDDDHDDGDDHDDNHEANDNEGGSGNLKRGDADDDYQVVAPPRGVPERSILAQHKYRKVKKQ